MDVSGDDKGLSRREQQIMDVLFSKGEASVQEVLEALPDAPGYSSVRKLLSILEEKGRVRHELRGKKYVYVPSVAPQQAATGALKKVLNTFFGGSLESALTTALNSKETKVSAEELARIEDLIRKAKEKSDDAS